MDYLFRWMELRFLSGKQLALFVAQTADGKTAGESQTKQLASFSQFLHESYEVGDAPLCCTCGVTDGAAMGAATSAEIAVVRVAALDSGAE